jgi:hypothetical protein
VGSGQKVWLNQTKIAVSQMKIALVKIFKIALQTGLITFVSMICIAEPTTASSDFLTQDIESNYPMEQVTSVADLSDVHPTDWAYQALVSLVDRHGRLIGDERKLFRGDRPLTRSEFAASLNQVMVHIQAQNTSEMVHYATQEDLEALRNLQEEFARELDAFKASLEFSKQLDQVEQLAFSTTAKLSGEVTFLISGVNESEQANGSGEPTDSKLTMGNRMKLELDASFLGKDQLNLSFKTGNLARLDLATATDMARLGLSGDRENQLELGELSYRFSLGDRTRVRIMALDGGLSDFAPTLNSLLDGTSDGAISRFAQRNPIYRQGSGTGVGLTYKFSEAVRLSLGYLARRVNHPGIGFGQADNGAIAQLTVSPSDPIDVALTYVRSYNDVDTGTGSERANDPFRDTSDAIVGNSLGLQTAIALSPKVLLTGWVGWTHAKATDLPDQPAAHILNWAATLAIQDLGKEGNLLGLAIGQPPKLVRNDFVFRGREYTDPDTSLHLEAFYQWQVVNNLAITFGWFMITNPEHNRNNSPIHVGTVRTLFRF